EGAMADLERISGRKRDVHCELGKVHYLAREFDRAALCFRMAIENYPEEGLGYHWESIVDYTLNNMRAAIESQSRAIDCNPAYHLYYEWRGGMRQMRGYLQDDGPAFEDFNRAFLLNPSSGNSRFWIGIIHLWSRDFRSAEKSFKEALELERDCARHRFWRDMAQYAKHGEAPQRVKVLKEAEIAGAILDPFERSRLLALIYLVGGDGQQSRQFLDDAFSSDAYYH